MQMDHHAVVVRGTRLGAGRTAVIVPLTAADVPGLTAQARAAVAAGADVVEWRADALTGNLAPADLVRAADALRSSLDDSPSGEHIPVLATVRTAVEGGQAMLTPSEYHDLLHALIEAHAADLLDVEVMPDLEAARDTVTRARRAGIRSVASNHDLGRTPPASEIARRLMTMQDLGADVAKVAVTPRDPMDVLALLHGTWEAIEAGARIPLITVSMGRLGAITRLGGGVFGSCATFAAVGEGSAPGQMDARGVRAALDLVARA